MNNYSLLQQFRDTVYHSIGKRADATLDLVDALTVAGHVSSPVALSEELPFRRGFSAVYDVLEHAELNEATLASVLYVQQPAASETIAGYEVYAIDSTADPRPEAETLPDRGWLKSQKGVKAQSGQKFSWLVRLVQQRTSWVAPQDVQRIATTESDSQTAVAQVQALDAQSSRWKVVVADSLYGNYHFLAVLLLVSTVVALVRLRGNLKLYEQPPPKAPGRRGRPRLHGPAFKLSCPPRSPDRCTTVLIAGQSVRLSAWHGLHLRKLPTLVGLVLLVEFLKADGSRRYKTPMWLFWTGPTTVPLMELCQMYLWRFAIEHAFRFLKQHLGLTAHQSTNPVAIRHWMWLCALAYWQLLLLSPELADCRPPWHPQPTPDQPLPTPGQAQRGALRFLMRLGTPATPPQTSGKGRGRPCGYCPPRRKRYEVVRKGKKGVPKAPKTALATG
jgi:hypothetical protein